MFWDPFGSCEAGAVVRYERLLMAGMLTFGIGGVTFRDPTRLPGNFLEGANSLPNPHVNLDESKHYLVCEMAMKGL